MLINNLGGLRAYISPVKQRLFQLLSMLIAICMLQVAVADTSILQVGDKSVEVLEMKQKLQELRYIEKGNLTKAFTEKTAQSLRDFQRMNGLPETGTLDEATRTLLFSADAQAMPYPTLPPLQAEASSPDVPWPERDQDGFLTGTGEFFYENDEEGFWCYLSDRLQVEITRMTDASIPLVWFETEIRTAQGEAFQTVATDPAHPGKKFRYPYDIARDEGFVLGFSDDFYATRMADKITVGVIIRNGEILSSETNRTRGHHLPNLDMMAQYSDGSLTVYECNEIPAETLLEKGAVNVFSFGPILIRDGEIDEMVYTWFKNLEPRQALGMITPNHYLLISVQGRTKTSKGTTLQRVAEIMKGKGVTQALNLDGGNTMALIFRGRMLNKLATYKRKSFVRTVTSLIGIGHTVQQAE